MSAARFRPDVDLPAEQVTANRRYWESEESVNGIAEAMGISKGRLYELLLPFDAELACPSCGGALGYAHRTARLRGDVACDLCGFEGSAGEIDEAAGPVAVEAADGSAAPEDAALWSAGPPVQPISQRTLAGALLTGLAVGIVLGGWLRR